MTNKVIQSLKEYQNWVMKTHFPNMSLEEQASISEQMLEEENSLNIKIKSHNLRKQPIKMSTHARTRN